MLEGKQSLREGCSGAGCQFHSEFRALLGFADLGDLLTFSRGFRERCLDRQEESFERARCFIVK